MALLQPAWLGPSLQRARRRACTATILSGLLIAIGARELVVHHAQRVEWSEATWVAAPVVQVDIAADPHVTSPAAELGDCDSHERFLVQAVVAPCRTHVVALAHFGGLYGP